MIAVALAVFALAGAVIFHAVAAPADRTVHPKALRELIMKTADAAVAIEDAATSLNTAATGLTTAANAIAAAIANAGDTTALDQPLADLASAVTNVNTAAAAVAAAVPA